MKKLLTFLILSACAGTASAQAPLRCVIEPDRSAEVGSAVIGVVETVYVERGDMVQKGQLLAQLRASVERASVGAAQVRAQADADIQAAGANYEFQRQKLARTEELMQKKFVSAQALDQVRAETSIAEQKLAQAREQKRVAREELEFAHAQLGMRQIRAPFAGIVADRYVNPGERVEVKPMFRIAKTDPLRVEIIVPAASYGLVQKGVFATVMPELPNAPRVDAKVVLVDRMVDAASNTFRVRAELPNAKGTIPSGLRCKAEIAGVTGTTPATPAPAAALPVTPKPLAAARMDPPLSTLKVR
jgi:cobalt-zinc-cadmium efflux system membrane fusion protein